MTEEQRQKTILSIARRITDEKRKHEHAMGLEWVMVAAAKIVGEFISPLSDAENEPLNLRKYVGTVKNSPDDAVAYQREMRNEWTERDEFWD
jgi:hypothetical protein